MKKLLSVLLIFIMALTITGSVLAQENPSAQLNEYEYIKELKQQSNDELAAQGFTEEQIKKIRDLDYAKELKKRASLDEKTLKNMGYDDKEIKKLKSFKGTEEEVAILAASVSLSVQHYSFVYNSSTDRSYWTVKFNWSWSSIPIFLKTDIIGSGWAPTMSLDTSTSNTYHRVYYKNVDTGNTYSEVKPFVLSNVNCGESDFLMGKWYNNSQDWAYKGLGYVRVHKGGYLRDMQMRIAYGHSQISISDPSLAYPWGISFTFSSGISNEADKTIQHYQ